MRLHCNAEGADFLSKNDNSQRQRFNFVLKPSNVRPFIPFPHRTMHAELESFYKLLAEQAKALISDETDVTANLANISALIFNEMSDLNWAGFYLLKNQQLVLGPFQGKPACVRIDIGKGVCGTAVATGEIQVVEDVHEFPGHIACDSASNSEVVLPIRVAGEIIGVLDIDSPSLRRFSADDGAGLQWLVSVVEQRLEQTL